MNVSTLKEEYFLHLKRQNKTKQKRINLNTCNFVLAFNKQYLEEINNMYNFVF